MGGKCAVSMKAAAVAPHETHQGEHRLVVQNLHAHYGSVCALREITFELACGRMVALIGGMELGKRP